MATWSRCGNTFFWSRSNQTLFINPVDLIRVASPWDRAEVPHDDVVPQVIRKEFAEAVDLQSLPEVTNGLEEQRSHYGDRYVRVFTDWMKARASLESREEALKRFRNLGPREQYAVLEVICDVLFKDKILYLPGPMAPFLTVRFVNIGWPGTYAFEHPAAVDEVLRATEPMILAENWSAGLDAALSYFGILEC